MAAEVTNVCAGPFGHVYHFYLTQVEFAVAEMTALPLADAGLTGIEIGGEPGFAAFRARKG